MTFSAIWGLALVVLIGQAIGGDDAWNSAMNAIQVECGQAGISQDRVAFVGFKDECDDESKVIYEPSSSNTHLDMVIDPRNSDTVDWDTARYKRYGTYWPTSNVTWHVPNGFTNFWTRIYYASDSDKKFEPMKYQYSKDGQNWVSVPNVQYDINVVCVQADCNWYRRKEEQATWNDAVYYFKAIWPAPCQGEIGATYAADQRKCLSLPPPGWTGTLEEFDASPLKDLYYTPQMSEIILGASDLTPTRPQNLKLTPGLNSVLATWDPPANPKEPIIGYTVYYQVNSIGSATDPNYKPPYLAKYINVGMVSGIVLRNINPSEIIIVRVAAISQRGSGPSTLNVWTQPLAVGTVPTCPATVAPVATLSPADLSPAPVAQSNDNPGSTTTTGITNSQASSAQSVIISVMAIIVIPIILVMF